MKKITITPTEISDLTKKYTIMYEPQPKKNNDENLTELALKYAPLLEFKDALESLNEDEKDINYLISVTPKEDEEYKELIKSRLDLKKEKKQLISSLKLSDDINFIEMVKDYDKIALNNLKKAIKDSKAKDEILDELKDKNIYSVLENELNMQYEKSENESKKK